MDQYNVALRMKYEQQCLDCGESDFVEDHANGDLICKSCGRVAESHIIDERSEWRTFGDKEKAGGDDPNRVGGPVNALLSDGGLSTMIGGGKGIDRGLANNLQRMQARTEVSGDRALIAAFREISGVCASMRLPDTVRHQANEYYKEALEKSKAIKGKQHSAVIAAIIFLACRQTGNPRTFKEIRAYVPAEVKIIGRIYKAIVNDLRLKESGSFRSEVDAIHPENFLRRFMSMLGFSNVDMKHSIALSVAMIPQGTGEAETHEVWHGKSPSTVAGTIIYIIANLPKASKKPSMEDISAVCGVAETTIRSLYRESLPFLPSLVVKAGNFASKEEIAKLPTLERPEKVERKPK